MEETKMNREQRRAAVKSMKTISKEQISNMSGIAIRKIAEVCAKQIIWKRVFMGISIAEAIVIVLFIIKCI